MVSSSPMKVAQFRDTASHTRDIADFDALEKPDSGGTFAHVYKDLFKSSEETKVSENGFTPSSDGSSERSLSASTGDSPRSAETVPVVPDKGEVFLDAQQTFPSQNGGLNGDQTVQTDDIHIPGGSDARENANPRENADSRENADARENAKEDAQEGDHLLAPRRDGDEDKDGNKKGVLSSHSTTSRRAVAAAVDLNDSVLVGTRVSEGHENFVTAYNMLTGIRLAVSRCTAKSNRALNDADFQATEDISFGMNGGSGSPSSRYIFQFKDYAPWVFRHLREAFGLDPADYLMSLTAKYIVSEMGSPGKSGSYFYYSRDFRFIIKTIRHSEHKQLRRVLRQYYSHVKANPNTLISQIYGLHRVKLSPGRKIHFLIMNNVFPALYQIHERYDLKGSLSGREYHPDPRKAIVVYKDLDWLRFHKRIILGREKREKLVKQLERDVRFLERINVMDYSLLVGIHDRAKGNAALDEVVRKFAQFGPQDERQSQGEKQAASEAVSGEAARRGASQKSASTEREFASLQTLLQRATPERLKEFDFSDDSRNQSYFYREHGGFCSTNEKNEELDIIYYVGVIDFLTGYTLRKSLETFCKSLIHDRRELSAVPANEYGDRFLKFMRGSIGLEIPSTMPHRRQTSGLKDGSSGVDTKAKSAKPTKAEERAADDGQASDTKAEAKAGAKNAEEEANERTHLLTPSSSVRSAKSAQSGQAITSKSTRGSTRAKASPTVSPSPDSSSRRPSVVGYGLDSHSDA